MAADPVFRPPTPEAKAQLGRTRKAIFSGDPGGPAQLQALFDGPEGPALARLALQDRDPRMQIAAATAATSLAKAHPRLFAFLPGLNRSTPPRLALATLQLNFATGCDTPMLFGMDALDHPSAEVVELAIRLSVAQTQQIRSPALADRVAAWLERRSGPARLRILAVRLLADLGAVHLTGLMARLSKDGDPLVTGEARVGWARLAPEDAGKQAEAWSQDRRPCSQMAALRATAEIGAANPWPLIPAVRLAARSPAVCADPLTGTALKVSDVAQQVLAYWDRGL